MAIHTVGECLELVEKRLEDARRSMSVRTHVSTTSLPTYIRIDQLAFQVHSHVQGAKTGMVVNEIDTNVKEMGAHVKESATLVKEIHAHLLGTVASSQPVG